MPRNETITTQADTWVEISLNDVSAVTLVNQSAQNILVNVTVGNAAPPPSQDGMEFRPADGASVKLEQMFPGVPGANRVWVLGQSKQEVFVSHA